MQNEMNKRLQEYLDEVMRTEPAFLTIRASLTDLQQERLDEYISACEELAYRQGLDAWEWDFPLHRPETPG